MVALREIFATFKVDFDTEELDQGNKKVEQGTGAIKAFGAAILASGAALYLRSVVNELQATGDSLGKVSTQLGVNADWLEEQRHAAGLASVQAEQFDQALRTLQRNQGLAAEGGKEQANSFKQLGFEMSGAELAALGIDQVLPMLADGLKGLKTDSERTTVAQKLLGDSGARLLPMFAQGAAGIEAARKELALLGGGFTEEAVKQMEALGDAGTRLDAGLLSVKVQIAKGIVPTISVWMEKIAFGLGRLSRFTDQVRELTQSSNILEGAFTVLGAAGLSKVFQLAGGWSGVGRMLLQATRFLGAFLVKLALPALIIDDLITTFQGGNSIIKDILDGWFGEGTTQMVVGFFQTFSGGWESAMETLAGAKEWVIAVLSAMGVEIGIIFSQAGAAIKDGIGSAWNFVIRKTIESVRFIADKMKEVPFVGGLVDGSGISGRLSSILSDTNNRERLSSDVASRRISAAERIEAAQDRIANNINAPQTINNTTNVTVPPGTDRSMAARVGKAATDGASRGSKKATAAALIPKK